MPRRKKNHVFVSVTLAGSSANVEETTELMSGVRMLIKGYLRLWNQRRGNNVEMNIEQLGTQKSTLEVKTPYAVPKESEGQEIA